MRKILEVKNLSTFLQTEEGLLRAVDDVSFTLYSGETLGIVGESGCGKSMTALSLLRLQPNPPAEIVSGEILLHSADANDATQKRTNICTLPLEKMRSIRGRQIAMIFQEPMTALNPVMRIGDQITEVLSAHNIGNENSRTERAIELLNQVGIPEPRSRLLDYPHQLSGGMRQRVMIAMALVCNPSVLIADEPTTALDVTIQAQILSLLKELQRTREMGMLLITHDFGVVAAVTDRVAVMYAGKIVEMGKTAEIFDNPRHPYTSGLLNSLPTFARRGTREKVASIAGRVPHLAHLPTGCSFQDRCALAQDKCRQETPKLEEQQSEHYVRCYYPIEESRKIK